MKNLLYILSLVLLFCLGCINPLAKKNIWHVSFKKDDKTPYGTYLAYQSLKYYFPNAKLDSLAPWFHYNKLEDKIIYTNSPNLLILVELDFYVSENELGRLLQFANAGNEIVLFCSHMDNKLQSLLNCYKAIKARSNAQRVAG